MSDSSPRWTHSLAVGAVATVLAGVGYALTMAQVHTGDTVRFVLELNDGVTNLIYLLPASAGDVSTWLLALDGTPASPFTAMAATCTVAGALAVGAVATWTHQWSGSRTAALLAAVGVAGTWSFWSLSTTFEVHIQPVAFTLWAAVAMQATTLPPWLRALLVGLLQGLAASFHALYLPILGVWALLAWWERGPRRTRLVALGLMGVMAVGVMQAAHLATMRRHAGRVSPVHLVALWDKTQERQGSDGGTSNLPWTQRPAAGLRGALATVLHPSHPMAIDASTGSGAVLLLGLLAGLGGAIRDRDPKRLAALAPTLAVAPLALWVEPENHEYWTVTCAGAWMGIGAVPARRWLQVPMLGVAAALGVGTLWTNYEAITLRQDNPETIPIGVLVQDRQTVQIHDGYGNSYLAPTAFVPFLAPPSRPPPRPGRSQR